MQLQMFSIKDTKGEAFGPIFLTRAHGEAERALKDEVTNPQSRINKHPTDFDLWHLGTYDDVTGKIEPLDAPRHIINAENLKN